jgi:hypothetical protein
MENEVLNRHGRKGNDSSQIRILVLYGIYEAGCTEKDQI